MPLFRITEESAKKGMVAFSEWMDAIVRKNPHMTERDIEVFSQYANAGFEAAWKFRDMVDAMGFETALAKLKAEARSETV